MFTTPVAIQPSNFKIDHRKNGLILGSCFAENIGNRLVRAQMPITLNPCGIMFNPASIGLTYSNITTNRQFTHADLIQHNGLWHSMQHHGTFSDSNPDTVLQKLNLSTPKNYDYIIITLGTAWVYEYQNQIVANCHKLPSKEFARRRLTVEQCVASLVPIARSGVDIILTVSPVRHIKDGLAENSLSKSVLRVATDELCNMYNNVAYFPSYEIVMDELRDYRYYADDMLHPSTVAVDYIWQRFGESYFTSQTSDLVKRFQDLNRAKEHRPLHPDSDEYRKFQQSLAFKERQLIELINR